MKFKVLQGTALFESIKNILDKRTEAIDAAKSLVKEFGAKTHRPSHWAIGTGISSICFEHEPDLKIWKSSGCGKLEFMPRLNNKTGKENSAKICALPEISYGDLNRLFGPASPLWCPSIIATEDCYLIEIPDQYQSKLTNTDLIEILNSEYYALKEAHEAKKTQPIQ